MSLWVIPSFLSAAAILRLSKCQPSSLIIALFVGIYRIVDKILVHLCEVLANKIQIVELLLLFYSRQSARCMVLNGIVFASSDYLSAYHGVVVRSAESLVEAMYSLMAAMRVSSINSWLMLRLVADSNCSSGKVSLISNVLPVISLFSSLDK
ncbi:hypothetical protein V6N13_034082 [Hibiscus sabdariffa]